MIVFCNLCQDGKMYHCSQKANIYCCNDISFNFHDLGILAEYVLFIYYVLGGLLSWVKWPI
jgi:hypothetical protein